MDHLINCCILLLYCVCGQAFYLAGMPSVVAFFAAVIAGSLLYLSPSARIRFWLTVLFAAALFYLPQLGLFLPLIAYFFCYPRECGPRQFFAALLPAALAWAGLLCHAWPIHRWQIFLFAAVGCAFATLLRLRTDACEKLYARYLQTRDSDTEIRLLLQEKNQSLLDKQDYEIYAATLKERNRIAREIHDNVGHMLTRSILMVGALKTINKDAGLKEPLAQLDHTLNLAMNSIRESVHDLHDRSVDLQDSLRALTQDFLFCPVTLQCDISEDAPAQIKYCFIAIVREALVNISRHSHATAACIRVQEHPAFYQLSIRDNGSDGGALSSKAAQPAGIGLANMQNRVAALRGTMQISSDNGFCIFITIPRQEKEQKDDGFTH